MSPNSQTMQLLCSIVAIFVSISILENSWKAEHETGIISMSMKGTSVAATPLQGYIGGSLLAVFGALLLVDWICRKLHKDV